MSNDKTKDEVKNETNDEVKDKANDETINKAKKEKKKWSKKKKIIVIICSVFAALIVIAVTVGVCLLHSYCKTDEYTVVSTSADVQLVAHRGMRSVAPENTTASFTAAGNNKYWGAECDVYRTKDGVWVVSHDSNTYRMMDKTAWIEKKTYNELKKMTVDNGVNINDYKDLTICTLEEYLKICRDFQMKPVIELKGKNNTEYYVEIVNLVEEYNLEAIYISFHFENLKAISTLTVAKKYLLVQKITEEDIETAKSLPNCGIDFNGNKEENYEDGIIEKCIDSGVTLGAWTINDIDVMEKLVENKVTLITTDCIRWKG